MINQSEYEKLCKLIEKGDLAKLQDYVDKSYEKGNKKYLFEARNALIDYLKRYPKSFIAYLDDLKPNENPLVETIFGQENKSNIIIISDLVSGGFILNSDEILNGSLNQRNHILKKHDVSLSLRPSVEDKKYKVSKIITNKLMEVDKRKLRLIDDEEIKKEVVCAYGRGYANPHYFERTRFNSFKLLGEEAKLYISSPKADPFIYGESSKGKGIVLGLRMDKKN